MMQEQIESETLYVEFVGWAADAEPWLYLRWSNGSFLSFDIWLEDD